MRRAVREWLPPGAAEDAAVRRLVAGAVDGWAGKWFARSGVAAASFAPAGASAPLRPGRVAASVPPGEATRLAGLALCAEPGRMVLSEVDRDIIGRFATDMAADLAAAIEAALGMSAPAGEASCEAGAAGQDGLFLDVTDRAGRALLHVAIPADALVAVRKAAMAAAPRPAKPLARLDGALDSNEVHLEARLGSAALSLGDLAGLAVGDVIVLDRRIEEGAALSIRDSARPFARGAIVPGDAPLNLLLQQ